MLQIHTWTKISTLVLLRNGGGQSVELRLLIPSHNLLIHQSICSEKSIEDCGAFTASNLALQLWSRKNNGWTSLPSLSPHMDLTLSLGLSPHEIVWWMTLHTYIIFEQTSNTLWAIVSVLATDLIIYNVKNSQHRSLRLKLLSIRFC